MLRIHMSSTRDRRGQLLIHPFGRAKSSLNTRAGVARHPFFTASSKRHVARQASTPPRVGDTRAG
ncbi:hypothetical protein C8R44DRAFT_805714 [Mycena epipterygia]|nr:hypothetical protein C8R44DRAFT_805714 [Mycena epipterygia]